MCKSLRQPSMKMYTKDDTPVMLQLLTVMTTTCHRFKYSVRMQFSAHPHRSKRLLETHRLVFTASSLIMLIFVQKLRLNLMHLRVNDVIICVSI